MYVQPSGDTKLKRQHIQLRSINSTTITYLLCQRFCIIRGNKITCPGAKKSFNHDKQIFSSNVRRASKINTV